MSNFMEIRPVRAALIHADGLTDIMKLIGFFSRLMRGRIKSRACFPLVFVFSAAWSIFIIINVSLFTFQCRNDYLNAYFVDFKFVSYDAINFYGRFVCNFVYLQTIHNILTFVGMFMFHVCNKFHMPSHCGLIGLSMSIKQKAKDNFRSVATLLLFILRSLTLNCSAVARIQGKYKMFN